MSDSAPHQPFSASHRPGNIRPQWSNSASLAGRSSQPATERDTLAQGLLRLERDSQPQQVAPGTLEGAPPTTGAPADTLDRIIARVRMRSGQVNDEALAASAGHLQDTVAPGLYDSYFYTDLRVMNLISHAIEEQIIARRVATEVYAGFQRFALLRPQLRRYRALAECADYLHIFGINDDDWDGWSNSRLVRFAVDPRLQTRLEYYWFVAVESPTLTTALLARHTEGDLWAKRQGRRRYTGIWTFDPQVVREIVQALREAARTLYWSHPRQPDRHTGA